MLTVSTEVYVLIRDYRNKLEREIDILIGILNATSANKIERAKMSGALESLEYALEEVKDAFSQVGPDGSPTVENQ